MVVPVSLHTGEWVLLTPIIPVPGQAPIRFEVQGTPPTIPVSPTAEYVCPASYTVPPAPVDQPHTTFHAVSTYSDGTHHFTDDVEVSTRTMQPTRWTSVCIDAGTEETVYEAQWMRHSGGDVNVPSISPPTGEGSSLNERWYERFDGTFTVPGQPDPNTLMFIHNPEMSGSGDRPEDPGDPGVVTKIYTGQPLLYEVASKAGTGGAIEEPVARIETAVVPLDFGGDASEFAFCDHGQGVGLDAEDEPAWWWRMRMWRRYMLNWNGSQAVRGFTKVDCASYFPGEWNNTDEGGIAAPLVLQLNVTLGTRFHYFDRCYMIDIQNASVLDITAQHFPPPPDNPQIEYASTHRMVTHRLVRGWTGTPDHMVVPSPVPTGYGCVALRKLSTDMCVAIVCKILPCNESQAVDSRTDTDHPCQMHTWHRQFPWTTDIESGNEGDGLFITHKSTTKRNAGWLFSSSFIYTGLYANLATDLAALLASGALDEVATIADIPQSVIDSTLPSVIVPPLPDLIVEDGTGLSNATSYISINDATEYLSNYRNPASWIAAGEDAKEQALRVATQWLDTRYGAQWSGIKVKQSQALDWPRAWASDLNGFTLTGVPLRLAQATAEMAVRHIEDPGALAPDVGAAAAGNIVSQTNTVGPISQSITYQGSTSVNETVFQLVERMISTGGLIVGGNYTRR